MTMTLYMFAGFVYELGGGKRDVRYVPLLVLLPLRVLVSI